MSTDRSTPTYAIPSSPRGCRSTATRPSPPSSWPTAPGPTRSPRRRPRWCAVDLRDGNQALIDPMTPDRKRRMFELLVRHGLQGDRGRLPGRQPDRLRLRPPADRGRPGPGRRHHPGADPGPRRADRAHLRVAARRQAGDRAPLQLDVAPCSAASCSTPTAPASSTSPSTARELVRKLAEQMGDTEIRFEYSPESFTGTELDFAVEICNAVTDVWEPTPDRPTIINLPATVEMAEPTVYADQIEWMHRNLGRRDSVVLQPAPAQRPRHRRRRRRAGLPRRRRPHRGLPVRQRRAHRQRRPGHPGPEPVQPGHRPADRLLRHRRDPPHRRVLQPARRPRAAPLRRRPGLHRLLRLPPGRDQQGLQGAGGRRRGRRARPSTRCPGRCRTCRSTPRTSAAATRP